MNLSTARALRLALLLSAILFLAPGCESASSQCRSSAECGPGERCVQGGGLYVIGGACVPEGEGIEDVGHGEDVIAEPDGTEIDVVTEPPPDSGPAPGPCHGVACSGRGLCVIAGEDIACLCDEGYRAEGLTCVAVAVEDLCEGIFCSGRGTCVLAAGEPACLCQEGYRPEGLSCIEISVENPCEGVTCSGHGTCVVGGQGPRCECDAYYRADGLSCTEICNGSIDTDGSCDIWVLRRGTEQWRGYRADPTGSGNGPAATIRAAFDVESQDLAFVLTNNAYHRFTPSNLSWGPALPLTDIATGLTTLDRIASASSVPGNHAGGDGTRESVLINGIAGGEKLVWAVHYNIAAQTFSRIDGAL